MKFRPFKQSIPYLRSFVVAIILIFAVGWILTGFLGRIAEKGFKQKVDLDATIVVSLLSDYLEDVDNAAKALSPSKTLVAALSSEGPADLELANRLLDRINNSLEMSVCYLMDVNGLTVASSNRNEKLGFVGKSFAFRPYFKGALAGRVTQFFALGSRSHERGYYAAAPVADNNGAIIGVVAVKRNITPVEKILKKYPHVFMVSPEGIIFITSREELLFRTLWPVAEGKRSELQLSGQFGNITFEPLLAAEPRTGTYVSFGDRDLYLQRLPFGRDGWSLVFMGHPGIVANYRLFGILVTIVLGLLLLFFINVLRHKDMSLEAARDLLKAKDDWKRTFDAVPDLIAIIDTNHRIISMNKAMAERLGVSRNEAIGRHCHELVHGSQVPPPYCPHQKMLDSLRSESESMFEKNLNGHFIVTAAPILAEDGTIESSVYVMHDVTEMKRLSDEVNRIHNLEAIGLLAGGLAHDFNNVLNIIYGNITLAKLLIEGNTAISGPLTDAEEACKRARDLGIRLQSFSQVSSPAKVPITLPAIIEEAAGTLFKGSNIGYDISAADDILPVEADPRQIRQMFENLLTNAKEAMSAGGTVKICIENCTVDGSKGPPLGTGRYVCIAIQDDGKGIPEENLPKIFDPYFSTKDTYSQKGLGLGLSICHTIVRRHGGQISVESRLGGGTRVTIYLPAFSGE